jgi:hypothetical protein
MVKLLGTHDNCITNLLHLRVKLLGSYQDLQNEVEQKPLLRGFVGFLCFFFDDQSSADN